VYYMNMKTHPNDASNYEVIEQVVHAVNSLAARFDDMTDAMHLFADSVDKRFNSVDKRFDKIESEMVTKTELSFAFNKFKTTMVTKGYLDDKLAEHHSELVQWTRSEIARSVK